MTTPQIKPALLLIVLVALTVTGCHARSPVPPSDVYISDPDKQLASLLLHEAQSLHVRSADATFQIINPFNDPCSIKFEWASCGCTNAEVDDKPLELKDRFALAAGGSARFKLTSRFPDKPGFSDFRATLIAIKSDGTQTEMSIHYGIKILADIVITPDVLLHEFRSLDDESMIKTIHVERRWRGPDIPFSMPTLGHLPPQLKILQIAEDKPPAQLEPGIWSRSWAISVSLSASSDLRSNPVRNLVSIAFRATANSDPISADLPVLVRLVSGIEAPDFIHFGSVNLGKNQTRRLVLRAADNFEFSVLNTSSTSSAFSVSKPSTTHGRTCWLELTFRPKELGIHRANIVLETTHPKSRQVQITVRGTGCDKE